MRTGRAWSLGLGFESHVALVLTQPDDARARPDKLYNYLVFTPALYLSSRDLLRAELGAFQYFTANPEESGLRLADWSFGYTR